MSKPIIHIGIAISTDGFLPTKSNILNIAATTGTHNFNQNVLPQYGHYKPSKFWEKFPDIWESFKLNTISYENAIQKFSTWAKNFQGNLIACTSGPEFWHLFQAMMEVCNECPFGSMPMDVNSYLAAQEGLKAPKRVKGDTPSPITVAERRWKAITGGETIAKEIQIHKLLKEVEVEVPQRVWRAVDPFAAPQIPQLNLRRPGR